MKEEAEDQCSNSNKQNKTATNSMNKHITIEDLEANPSRHLKITSPRSILALKSCGIIENELYQISFKEYKQKFHETKTLPDDIQLSRYQFYESRRIEKINKVKAKRNQINLDDKDINTIININHSQYDSFKLSKSLDMHSISNNNSLIDKSDNNLSNTSLISKDIKELEQMKKKNESEMLSIIQSEIRRINMIREAERKSELQKARFSRSQEEQRLLKEEVDRNRKEKEDQRVKRQEKEEERQNQLKKEIQRKAEEKQCQELINEQQKEEELKQKKDEESAKRTMFQQKINKIHNDQQRIINQKQQRLLTRDEDRQLYMEHQRSVKQLTQIEKSKSKKEKIDKNRTNLELKMRIIHDALVRKQKIKLRKMENFEASQSQLYQKQRDLSLQKQIEIQNVLERNQLLEKQKIIEYDKNQERIRERKMLFERMMNEEKEKTKKQNKAKAEHIQKTLIKNERQEIARKEYLLSKREEKDESLQKILDKKRMESIVKAEEFNKKFYLIEDNFKMIARVHEFDIEKVKIKQNVKDRSIDEFMKQKRFMINKKRALQEELSKVKQTFLSRFHDVTTKKNLDSTTIESFRDIFPNNPSFDKLVQQCDSKEGMRGLFFTNSGLSRPNMMTQKIHHGLESLDRDRDDNSSAVVKKMKQSHSVSSMHFPMTLNERIASVQERVVEYRHKLSQEILLLIQEERQKELEREKVVSNHQNANERKRLEELFGQERGKASMKIIRLNESINKKVGKYESLLRVKENV